MYARGGTGVGVLVAEAVLEPLRLGRADAETVYEGHEASRLDCGAGLHSIQELAHGHVVLAVLV